MTAAFSEGFVPPTDGRWVRGIAAGLALSGCVVFPNARTSLAASGNDLIAAFSSADGKRSTIKTSQQGDGPTKVTLRGEYYDGRPFLRAVFAGLTMSEPISSAFDVDLDVKVSTFAGFNDEALHDVELRLSEKRGEIVEFALSAKLGLADLRAELRRGTEGRLTVYLETDDAGAFLRFTSVYQGMERGRAWIAMDVPTPNRVTLDGVLDVHDFIINSATALKPFAMMPKTQPGPEDLLSLSHLRFGFKLSSDQVVVDDGIVIGPSLGATATGKINFVKDDVKLGGAMIRLFTLDQGIPPSSPTPPPEGMFCLSYRIEGQIEAPVMSINPAGPLAPGLLRKLFFVVAR